MNSQTEILSKESFFRGFGLQKLITLLEKLPIVMVVVDSQEKLRYINRAGERLYQCAYQEAINRPVSNLLFLSDKKIVSAAVARAFKAKIIVRFDWEEEQYYEGRVFYREGTIVPLLDQDGNAEYALMTIVDNTEQIRSEKKLLKSQEYYRMLFEGAPDAIIIMKGKQIIGANPASEKITGYKKEELSGRYIWEISPKIQSSGILSEKAVENKITQSLTDKPQLFEWQFLTKKGATVNTRINLTSMRDPTINTEPLIQAIVRESEKNL
ncbi:MAG: PAS domain-containing protein [Proteobacteria bacterium]|nr:PAS domain-containing protein [Pseudomonadota bacterium]